MDNHEIIFRLNEADLLLSRYKEILTPVLVELANRKMQAVGIPYSGKFGCFEEGIDTLCMHKDGDERPPLFDAPYDWEDKTREQFFKNLQNISLSGFF